MKKWQKGFSFKKDKDKKPGTVKLADMTDEQKEQYFSNIKKLFKGESIHLGDEEPSRGQ